MSVKHILKISLLGVSFLTLAACSTSSDFADQNLNNSSKLDKATVHGAGDVSTFYNATNPNALKVANQTYYFGFDQSKLASDVLPSLEVQANYLLSHPQACVLISGNTDERGSREYNIALGQRRALSIAHYLQSKGVDKHQIHTVSYGAEKPVALGHTEADYAKNRRATLEYQHPIN